MPKEEKERESSVLPGLAGAAAGVSTDEARRIPRLINNRLADLVDVGIKSYPEASWGQLPDFKTLIKAWQLQEAMGAPSTPVIRGPYAAFVNPPQVNEHFEWLGKKFPGLAKALNANKIGDPFIMIDRPNTAALAHEIGHSIKSPILGLALYGKLLRGLGLAGGVGAALTESEGAQSAAPFIAGAGAVPDILEEGRATAHAVRGVKRVEGGKEALKTLGRLTPAIGTYAVGAVPLVLAPYVARAVKEYMEKESAEKPVQIKTEGKLRAPASKAWATSGPKPKSSTPGKAKSTSIKLPSKRKFYRDMQRQLNSARGDRMSVKQASVASGLVAGVATFPVKNLIFHAMLNTRVSPKAFRKFIENLGDEYLKAGFRHAIVGKKVSPSGVAGMTSGAIGGAAPMMMYNQGHEYGKAIYNTIKKIPLVQPKHPLEALRAADTAITSTSKASPYLGIAGGGAYGYLTGKTKKEKLPLKAILSGAVTGGLLGKGVKHVAPHLPPMKQLTWVRKKVLDPTLEGSETRLGKILDKMAK